MKRLLLSLSFFSFIVSGCNSQGNENQTISSNSEVQSDWPAFSLKELTEKADLIAFVSVTETKKREKSSGITAQISTLKVNETISGNAPEKIALDQSTNYVEKGEDYLIFLEHSDNEYYYILSPSGVIQVQEGVYTQESEGQFTKEEVRKFLLN